MGKVFNTEEFIIAVFCCIEDWLNEIIQGQRIRAAGFEPKLSDSEVRDLRENKIPALETAKITIGSQDPP